MSIVGEIERQAIAALDRRDEDEAKAVLEMALRLLARCQSHYGIDGLIMSQDAAGRYNVSTIRPPEVGVCIIDVGLNLYWHDGGKRLLARGRIGEHPADDAMKSQ